MKWTEVCEVFFHSKQISAHSFLFQVEKNLPGFFHFLEKAYGLRLRFLDRWQTFERFCSNKGLPPAQILFLQHQMSEASKLVGKLRPKDAVQLIEDEKPIVIDARECWERKYPGIEGALPLNDETWAKLIQNENRSRSVLIYCHFGIRSLDAAHAVAEQGFSRVYIVEGGVDAWAADVDPNIPRYEGSYC